MKTNDSKDQGREAFEAWMAENRPDAELYRRDVEGSTRYGEYCKRAVQDDWILWQAALATSASALARDEAKELCARCNCWVRLSDDCNLCRSADDAKPVGEASVASVSADALRRNVRLRLKVEKLASLLTKTEEGKRDIVAEENEVTGVRIGWGAWALLRAAIIDVIEHKCEFDEALAASSAATVSDAASVKRLRDYMDSLAPPIAKRYLGEAIAIIEQQARAATVSDAASAELTDDRIIEIAYECDLAPIAPESTCLDFARRILFE